MKQTGINPLQKPVIATVTIPGSKSITNRALVMAALTKGTVNIAYPLWSDDTEAMIECLETLGIRIERGEHTVSIHGSIADVKDAEYVLNARLSGTTIRFITALASIVPGEQTIYGVGRLNERPIRDLVEGLRQLGVSIEYEKEEGYPPIRIQNGLVREKAVTMDGGVSSQYFTALLLIAPVIGGLTIDVKGSQISKSYIDITIDMMREWGIEVINESYKRYIVPAGEYNMKEYTVEGDYSAAGYFAGIAALTGSTVTLENLNRNSKQGDKAFLRIIEKMGNKVLMKDNCVIVEGKGVQAGKVDMEDCPDQAQTLAVLAAFADGVTRMTGVRSLRVKETERVKAVQAELGKMGIRTESPDEDTLIVHGGTPHGASIDTYHDHRMAMSFAMSGTKINGMRINDPEVVNKTFPDFWKKLESIGINLTRL